MGIADLPIHHNITSSTAPPPPPPPPYVHHQSFMHFYWGAHAEVLFSGWPGDNKGMYALAVIFVFFLAVLVELFVNINLVKPGSDRVWPVLSQMGIRGIRAGLTFMVMLSVISYNGGILIAAVVGHAIGYVIFGSPIFKKGGRSI